MFANREIRRAFGLYAQLLLLHEKDERLAVLLSGAAYRIGRMDDAIMDLRVKEWKKLFRAPIVSILEKLRHTGALEDLDELIQLTPTGLFELMRIRGLGGKKLNLLWKNAGIDNVEHLLTACRNGKVRRIPGFGKKTEENLVRDIENYFAHKKKFYYATLADAADLLLHSLRRLFDTKQIEFCGEIRRQSPTLESIEFVAAGIRNKMRTPKLRKYLLIESHNEKETKGHTLDEFPVTIYHTSPSEFVLAQFMRTGSQEHVENVLGRILKHGRYRSEKDIYHRAGLPFIVPEMRENLAEWNFPDSKQLVEHGDIRGVVHNHTTWSDGVDSLEQFAAACKAKGFEYVVIADHSKNAHYAGGMKEEKLFRQLEEIDELNKKLKSFHIFKSIECDILVSGELDYSGDVLDTLDLVIVSVHQQLKMDEERATRRLIRAIENPHTTILGHMTGRQLLIRSGYPVIARKIIDACAANGVVIELNANPYRLDIDWSQIPYAVEKNVMVSVNPDAHSIAEIDNIRWGVSAARKGGLTKDMTWNAMSLKKLRQWLAVRNRKFARL